jgi:hypothetical protein
LPSAEIEVRQLYEVDDFEPNPQLERLRAIQQRTPRRSLGPAVTTAAATPNGAMR